MEAYYSGDDDPSALENYIQQNLNTLGKNQNYEIAYLGAQLDTSLIDSNPGSDNLSPALNSAESQVQSNNNDKGKRTVTFVGGLMVAGFLAAFLGIFFMLYRRRQKFLSAQDVEIALSKSDLDDASLREQRRERDRRQQSGDDLDEPEIGEEYDNNYTFDLGSSMKHELFNIHGRATADQQKQYGIGIEETSDSDADSWAQTDGTIGSLELQLEPITAEV